MENCKAKFICSYGGKIERDTHDHTKLSYLGGHTKILYIHRTMITFPTMLAKLAALFNAADGDVSFKYQLPGEDFDSLISVTDDNDLENMMIEYDQLRHTSDTPARLRLFLFPNNNLPYQPLDSDSARPDPVISNPNGGAGGVVGIASSFCNTLALPSKPDNDIFGSVDQHMDQWLLQEQFLPSIAGAVPGYGASSSTSSSPGLIDPLIAAKYDVFISFRGEDTRTNFTCHLHCALSQKRIKTFIDYELRKGYELSPSLSKAIENSYVSVVVFSENYASSKWCLEELLKILECRTKHGQVVIPVFYNIDPSHVRKQEGSYKRAFEKHLQNSKLDMNKVQKWKDALAEAANLSGWDSHSRSYRDDSELIERIVKDVLQKLNYHYPSNNFKGLVNIYNKAAPIESLLREALSVGIWGIGGIGKTTIARYIFDKYCLNYEGSCFLENIRERSGEHGQGLHLLRNQLHSELLQDNVFQNRTARSILTDCRVYRQRNFIVLDDVSSSKQLEYLVGELQSYGPGSKIIITTRDKSVLENRRVEKVHLMEGLYFQVSLELFCLNAFNEYCPRSGYKKLSKRAVTYCNGVPLALVVLGSFLHSKSKIEWDSALKKLQKIPREEILNVLRLSYDALNYEEQQIFLDIACFLKGISKTIVVDLLDCCGFYPVIGMRSLLDKALITISSNNTLEMHDLVQQMGWEIVRQESIRNPGKRSRLWDFDDVCDVLKNNKGTKAIQGIMLDMSLCRQNLCLSPDTFKKMPNLRYLRLFTSLDIDGRLYDLHLPSGLESLPDKIRYLEWHACPMQSLPSNFCPENLVTLRMPHSQIKRLWSGVQNLVNLKEVDLAECRELIELPDFSKANNLESVDLSYCRSLRHVHQSILSLGRLGYLNLHNCKKIKALESEVHLGSLQLLHIQGCSSLRKVSLSLEAESLNFSTRVKLSHLSFGCLSKVKDMYVNGSRLENLPEGWSCLKSLRALLIHSYSQAISKQTLHVIFDGLQYLQQLTLLNCHGLFELPDNINCLSSLQILELDGSAIERLPESIKHLSRLETLSLCNCKRLQSLPELPLSIINLKAFNCPLVQMEASSSTNSRQQDQECTITSFQNVASSDEGKCIHLFCQSIRELVDAYELRERVGVRAIQWPRYLKIYYPDNRIPNWFTCQTKGSSISFEITQPLDHYFSFLLCVVLPPITTSDAKLLQLKYNCWLEDGRFSGVGSFADSFAIMEDLDFHHVFMSFIRDGILDHIKQQRVNQNFIKKRKRKHKQSTSYRCNPKITLEFFGCTHGNVINNWFIQECGVYPLSTQNMR